jgi:hypothetical protein
MVMEILTRYQSSVLLMLQKILAAIVICLYFTACTKDATVKLPDTAPKPVLVCFVSPEDPFIRVKLTNSVPLYSSSTKNYPFEIKDAEVIISNGITSAQVTWYKDSVGYLLSTRYSQSSPAQAIPCKLKFLTAGYSALLQLFLLKIFLPLIFRLSDKRLTPVILG